MDDKVELDEGLIRVQLKFLRKKGITKEAVDKYNQLTGGDVARPATDPEQRDEEKKKMVKDAINEVFASRDGWLTAKDLNLVQTEFSTQVAGLREHFDTKFEKLATGQGDALRVSEGISQKLDTLVAEREKASETTGSCETNILGKIETLLQDLAPVVEAFNDIKSWVDGDGFGGKMENLLNALIAKQRKTLPGLTKELHGSENNAPLANASDALETDTPTQTTGQDTGKKKKKNKAQPSAMTATTTTTKGSKKCMGRKKENGEPCDKRTKDDGFLTCGYHRAQEEELRKKTVVPHVDSTASLQDTATNAQAPPTTTQPSVAQHTRKSSGLKPPGVTTRKRKRGDDEEELEHIDHSPDEIGEDCPACQQGATLTQPSSHILHSERVDQRDYDFGSPEPEAHGLPPSPAMNGPLLPSPTSTEADRFDREAEFRNQDELIEELRQSQQRDKRQYKPSSSKRTPYDFIDFKQGR